MTRKRVLSITRLTALTDDSTNLKMFLGLIWMLIQRYSVQKQYDDDDDGEDDLLLAWTKSAVAKSCANAGVVESEAKELEPKSWRTE